MARGFDDPHLVHATGQVDAAIGSRRHIADHSAARRDDRAGELFRPSVELNDGVDISFAHNLLQKRRIIPYWKLEDVQGESPVRLYKATPILAWTNGESRKGGTYIDTRDALDD